MGLFYNLTQVMFIWFGCSVIINMFIETLATWINDTDSLIPMILFFWQQCFPHRDALLVNTKSRNWLKAKIKITAITDYVCVTRVSSVKSMTDDFQHGGFLSAQMAAVFNSWWFSINSCQRWDNPSRDAATIKREPKQYDPSQTGNLGPPEDVCWQLPR